jgi:hypothetical protein
VGVLDEPYSADYKVRLKLPPLVAHTKDIWFGKREGKLAKRLKEFALRGLKMHRSLVGKKPNCNLSPNLHLNEMEQIQIKWCSEIRI